MSGTISNKTSIARFASVQLLNAYVREVWEVVSRGQLIVRPCVANSQNGRTSCMRHPRRSSMCDIPHLHPHVPIGLHFLIVRLLLKPINRPLGNSLEGYVMNEKIAKDDKGSRPQKLACITKLRRHAQPRSGQVAPRTDYRSLGRMVIRGGLLGEQHSKTHCAESWPCHPRASNRGQLQLNGSRRPCRRPS